MYSCTYMCMCLRTYCICTQKSWIRITSSTLSPYLFYFTIARHHCVCVLHQKKQQQLYRQSHFSSLPLSCLWHPLFSSFIFFLFRKWHLLFWIAIFYFFTLAFSLVFLLTFPAVTVGTYLVSQQAPPLIFFSSVLEDCDIYVIIL